MTTGEKRLVCRPSYNSPIRLLHKATNYTQQQILYEHHEYGEVRAALELMLLSN